MLGEVLGRRGTGAEVLGRECGGASGKEHGPSAPLLEVLNSNSVYTSTYICGCRIFRSLMWLPLSFACIDMKSSFDHGRQEGTAPPFLGHTHTYASHNKESLLARSKYRRTAI